MKAAGARLHGDQLIATQQLAADPTLVWEAFTTPEHLAAFWGGRHATVPSDSVSVDLQVGGAFELETVGADGTRRQLRFRYEVIDAPTRLVLSEPRTGITTEILIEGWGTGTVVPVHQRKLPPELRSDQARTGLAGILQQLEVVVREVIQPRSERP
jgi:uncharacterized protein YndB with AHSA1/START domain